MGACAQSVSSAYGAHTIPGLDVLDADKLLHDTLGFLRAVGNKHCAEVWRTVCADRPLPIAATFAHNPQEVEFNERSLPALFACHPQSKFKGLTEDMRLEAETITLLCVAPPAPQQQLARRAVFAASLFKTFDWAIERDYDLSWEGGALLSGTTKHRRLHVAKLRPQPTTIDVDGSEPRRYSAWEGALSYEEEWRRDRDIPSDDEGPFDTEIVVTVT